MNDQPPIGVAFLIAVVLVCLLGSLGAFILALAWSLACYTIARSRR